MIESDYNKENYKNILIVETSDNKKFNVSQEYKYYNRLLFNNRLLKIKFKKTRTKSYIASVNYQI